MNYNVNLNSFIPVTRFNRGEAEKILDEVKHSGIKVIVKNNTPAAVMLSPKEYEEMINFIEDTQDYLLALEREKNNQNENLIDFEDFLKSDGTSIEELENMEDVELEYELED